MRFYGPVGYVGEQRETRPGVWESEMIERQLYGDVVRNALQVRDGQQTVNSDLSVNNSISVVADAYARDNFAAIRYVKWAGVYWEVTEVTVQSPRLILRLGGVYNGKTGSAQLSPEDPL